jgi:hypothetical protein
LAYQSVWYFSNINEEIVDIIERDLSETFDSQMADSKLHGDALNKDKRNSQNAWIPTTHWVGGFLWHYIQRANRENFLYDLRCIDGESMQYTPGIRKVSSMVGTMMQDLQLNTNPLVLVIV